jgi:hypothetical protein
MAGRVCANPVRLRTSLKNLIQKEVGINPVWKKGFPVSWVAELRFENVKRER